MKAKDTVMSYERIQEIDLKNAESNFTDALWDVAREQAQVSFKKGIKEVTEWIREYSNLHYTSGQREILFISKESWQQKLREWGIECH